MPTLKEIGNAGEEIVSLVYRKMGHNVVLSKDKFDPEKDMMIDSTPAEVKTQTIFRMFEVNGEFHPAFTVDIETGYGKVYHNQLNKCKTVEKLIFVARSSENKRVVEIYEAPPPADRKYHVSRNKRDNRLVAGFLISDMTLVSQIKEDTVVNYFMDNWRSNAKSR